MPLVLRSGQMLVPIEASLQPYDIFQALIAVVPRRRARIVNGLGRWPGLITAAVQFAAAQ